MGCARSHNLVGHGQRLADVVQHEVRVDALRRGVVDQLRGPHELLAHELVLTRGRSGLANLLQNDVLLYD